MKIWCDMDVCVLNFVQIMIRVKDAELQKLRSQVKNLENSLHRTTEVSPHHTTVVSPHHATMVSPHRTTVVNPHRITEVSPHHTTVVSPLPPSPHSHPHPPCCGKGAWSWLRLDCGNFTVS